MLHVANIDAGRIGIDLRKAIQRFAFHPRLSHRTFSFMGSATSARVPSV
jgi:hypothetical protein